MLTSAEENYLKSIYKILESGQKAAQTNAIAAEMKTAAASATDMVKRLSDKALVEYERYRGVTLTSAGHKVATSIVRKHRLWEVFLVDKLGFGWEEVHEIAEQLEHIQSEKLIRRLDEFLGRPKFDPHGDPIPDDSGKMAAVAQDALSRFPVNRKAEVTAVSDQSAELLGFLKSKGLQVGTRLEILQRFSFDQSVEIKLKNQDPFILSSQVAAAIYAKPHVKNQ